MTFTKWYFILLFRGTTKAQLFERQRTLLDAMAGKEQKYIIVRRQFVFDDVLEMYRSNPDLPKHTINVEFQGEMGDVDGLTREMFALFWGEARDRLFDGSTEVTPVIDPSSSSTFYLLGIILTHGFILTGFFPVFIAQAVSVALVAHNGSGHCSEGILLASFCNYVSLLEKLAVESALGGPPQIEDRHKMTIIEMLSRMQNRSVPTSSSILRATLITCARSEFLFRPAFAISEMRRGMEYCHGELWASVSSECVVQLYAQLIPTAAKLITRIQEPICNSPEEDRVCGFL